MNDPGVAEPVSQERMSQASSEKQRPMENYQFSPEEMKVLRECNRDSFYQRSLPLSTILGAGTFYGVKAGYFSASPKWGPSPKVMLACTIGYFLGKISYQQKCAEKIMQLPNSRLGQMLRQRRTSNNFQDSIDPGGIGSATMTMAPFGMQSDVYTDVPTSSSQNSLDMDTYHQIHDRLDDMTPPILDDSGHEDVGSPKPKSFTTYDDLRKKNRDEYADSKNALFRPPPAEPVVRPPPAEPFATPPPAPPLVGDTPADPQRRRNKYGDVWE